MKKRIAIFLSWLSLFAIGTLGFGCNVSKEDAGLTDPPSEEPLPPEEDEPTEPNVTPPPPTFVPDENGIVYISTYEELRAIAQYPNGHYVLLSDIDCNRSTLNFGDFHGTLDGDGHTIFNITNFNNFQQAWNNVRGIFTTITKNAVVKNLGFYNVTSTYSDLYNFALAEYLEGRIENVSFHQGGTVSIGAVFGQLRDGCVIRNFVSYAHNVQISAFFNSGARIDEAENIYIFGNKINSTYGRTQFFETGETKEDYQTTEAFQAIKFREIFDCGKTGVWRMDLDLKIPLIKKGSLSIG